MDKIFEYFFIILVFQLAYVNKKIIAFLQAILCCVLFTGVLALAGPLKHMLPPQFERYAYGVIGIIVSLLVVWLFCKWVKKQPAYYGLQWGRKSSKNFLIGFVFGLILSALAFFIVIWTNGLSVVLVTNYNIGIFFIWAMSLLLLSLMEEIAFRSFAFIHLKNNIGIWPTQITIAILFALYHVVGGQDIATSFMGPGVWAFIFGWAVLRSGGIAMATGIHFAANLLQTAIGQKSSYPSIWKVDISDGISATLQQQINTTGMLVQGGILIVGIVLTIMVQLKKLVV